MKNKYIRVSTWIIGFILFLIILLFSIFNYNYRHNPIKIAFLGDSITYLGFKNPKGFVNQFVAKAKSFGINIIPISDGIPGFTTSEMLEKMNNDVIKQKPDFVFIMGGTNDVIYHWDKMADYINNMRRIVDISLNNDIKPVLLTITARDNDFSSFGNMKRDKYNTYLYFLAGYKKIQIIDVNTPLKKEMKRQKYALNTVTRDGIHLNEKGETIVANKITADFVKKYYTNYIFNRK